MQPFGFPLVCVYVCVQVHVCTGVYVCMYVQKADDSLGFSSGFTLLFYEIKSYAGLELFHYARLAGQ